jgi:translocator protein
VDYKKIVLAIIACNLVGITAGAITAGSVSNWYATLEKPVFTPPNWVFAPAWTILYTMMGIALGLVWQSTKKKERALRVFRGQLALNFAWSIAFFGFESPAAGLAVIAALLTAILYTARDFYRVDARAYYLLFPYFAWTSFAALLNYAVWALN